MGAEPRIRVSALLRWGDGGSCSAGTRSAGKGVWLLPGGGVHSGETLMDALEPRDRGGGRDRAAAARGADRDRRLDRARRALWRRSTSSTSSSRATSTARSRPSPRRTRPSADTGSSLSTSSTAIVLHPPIQRFLAALAVRAIRRCILERCGPREGSARPDGRLRGAVPRARSSDTAGRSGGVGRRRSRDALGGPLPDEGSEDAAGASRADRRSRAWHRRDADRPLLRLRLRERAAGGGRGRLAGDRLGPERLLGGHARPLPPPSRRSPRDGSPSCSGCRPASRAASSRAPRARTPPRSRRRGTTCSPRPAGTSSATVSPERRRSASSSGASDTSRSTARSACSGSGPARSSSSPSDDQGRMHADALREALARDRAGRRSSALRPATSTRAHSIPSRRSRTRARPPAPGCTSTAPSGSGLPPRPRSAPRRRGRARRLLGDGRPQVAERPLRLRPRLLPAPEAHAAAMAVAASYLQRADGRSPSDWVPESSRRARGFAVWAAVRSLGRSGVAELVERCCDHARAFARAARRRAGRRDPERRRSQPGAGPLRRRRRDDP